MSGVGAQRLDQHVRASRGQTTLRARLAHDYAKAYGRDARYDCLDGLERWARWRQKLPEHERHVVLRTIRQLADAFERPHKGAKDAHQRYQRIFKLQLGYLKAMGWVESFEPIYEANGEGKGILVRWAPVAQLDRGPAYPRGRERCSEPPRRPPVAPGAGSVGGGEPPGDRSFSGGEVMPPSGRSVPSKPVVDVSDVDLSLLVNGGASARVPADASALPSLTWAEYRRQARLVVRASAWWSFETANGASEGDAARKFSELPWAAEVPITDLARILHRCWLPDVPPLISAKRQAQLEAAARRIDRIEGPGAWIAHACSVLECWAEGELDDWLSEPPRSLGALAIWLRRTANERRFWQLERRHERLRPLAAARQRQAIKRWRPAVRRGDAARWSPGHA